MQLTASSLSINKNHSGNTHPELQGKMQEGRPFFQAAQQLPPAAPAVPKPALWQGRAALPPLLQGAGADRDPTDLLGKGSSDRISASALTAAVLFLRGVTTTGRGA